MAAKDKDFKVSAGQLIFPLSLTTFVVFLMLAFQTSQLLRDRDTLHFNKSMQEKPLQDVQKVQAQLDALAVGTRKLADHGNKNAQTIINRLKEMGITVNSTPKAPAKAAAPAIPASKTDSPAPAQD